MLFSLRYGRRDGGRCEEMDWGRGRGCGQGTSGHEEDSAKRAAKRDVKKKKINLFQEGIF